jgi:hypothetical protein
VVVPSGGVRGSGSVTYDSTYVFLQIHFLRSILRRPYTDRISEGVKKSSGGTGIVIPVEKVPQERKTQESGGFLQEYANNALPPAPHRCTAAAAPTTLHYQSPTKGAIAEILQTPHHQRFALRKASEGVRRLPPPSFDCCVCAASQSAIVANIEHHRRH